MSKSSRKLQDNTVKKIPWMKLFQYLVAPLIAGVVVALITSWVNVYNSERHETESKESVIASTVFIGAKDLIGAGLDMRLEIGKLSQLDGKAIQSDYEGLNESINRAVSAVVELRTLHMADPGGMSVYRAPIDEAYDALVELQAAVAENRPGDVPGSVEKLINSSTNLSALCLDKISSDDIRQMLKGEYGSLSPKTALNESQ